MTQDSPRNGATGTRDGGRYFSSRQPPDNLVVTAGFAGVELGPGLLREVRGSSGSRFGILSSGVRGSSAGRALLGSAFL